MTMLLGVGLSALALVATPLAARFARSKPNAESGFLPTTILSVLLTGLFGVGATCVFLGLSDFGSTMAFVAIAVYFVAMAVIGRFLWPLLGPDRVEARSAPQGSTIAAKVLGA